MSEKYDCKTCEIEYNTCEVDCEDDSCQKCFDDREADRDREHDEMCALGYK